MNEEGGLEPSDTLEILARRTKNLRAKREHVEWSSISLEMQGFPIKPMRSYGEARIDDSLVRNLSGVEPTSFRVEPGLHTVRVHLSRWLRLRHYRRSAKLSIDVSVPAGEQVRLVCGLRPGAREEWRMLRLTRIRTDIVFCTGSLLALVFGWFLFSLLARLLAPAAIFIVIRGVQIPQFAIGLALRTAVIAPIFLPWWLLATRLILASNRRVLQSLEHRFVEPYFLKKSEEPVHGRQPAY